MWDIKCLVYDFFHTKSVQEFINHRFSDKNAVIMDLKYYDYVVMKNLDLFFASHDLTMLPGIYEIYKFNDIRKDDIVVDIGANIGVFSVLASRMSDHVYAVEPIMVKELQENVVLNKRTIHIIEGALGDGNTATIEWEGLSVLVKTMTLSEIKNRCGGCDFLKLNCEGAEWGIKPEEFKGIRRIEMMVHIKHRNVKDMVSMLSQLGFNVQYHIGGRFSGSFDSWWMVSAEMK